jgi:hypothetical protein
VEFKQYNTGEGAAGAAGVGFTYTVPVAAIWQEVVPSVTVTLYDVEVFGVTVMEEAIDGTGLQEYIGDNAFVVTERVADDPSHMVKLLTDAVGIFFIVAITGTLADKQPLIKVLETA